MTRLEWALILARWSVGTDAPIWPWYEARIRMTGGTDRRLDTLDERRFVQVIHGPGFDASFGVGDILPAPMLDSGRAALVWYEERLWKLGSWEWRRVYPEE